MTTLPTPVDVAVAYLQAWASGDTATVATYLAEDVTFEGPMAQATGAQAVLDAISDGRIHASRLVFDTYEVRKAQVAQAPSA